MPTVVAPGVGGLQPMHSSHQIRLWRLHQEMVVIAHQNVSVHSPAVALTDLPEAAKENFPILVVQEDCFPPIAPAQEMIERPFEFYPRHSGHRTTICRFQLMTRIKT